MTKYTVVGLWEDNGQTYSEHIEASDQYEAMGLIGKDQTGLTIIGAFEGHHLLLGPSDDNYYAASGEDMAALIGIVVE